MPPPWQAEQFRTFMGRNTDPTASRDVVIQAGAYAEHQFTGVRIDGRETAIGDTSLGVHLAPGAGATLEIDMERYVNAPTFASPWDR